MMRTFPFFYCLLSFACGLLFLPAEAHPPGSDPSYAVFLIPDSLRRSANAVVREESIDFTIRSTTHTVWRTRLALTVLNEGGDDFARFYERYDKLRQVSDIDGTLYDALGASVRRLKPKEIIDGSDVDEGTFATDSRYKTHHFYHKIYPYTVVYAYTVRSDHSFYFPPWIPQGGEHLSVQKSEFTVHFPRDYALRFRAHGGLSLPLTGDDRDGKWMRWALQGAPGRAAESLSPPWMERAPWVSLAPSAFEMSGHRGDMTDWTALGKFLFSLTRDRYTLPDATKARVREIVAGLSTDREKVEALYRFMQSHTRYISVQFGIGGFQPFPADYVATKGYGDCKALSNYMYSLLREAGIPSVYAVIKAGRNAAPIQADFPSNQFNHVVLCVPQSGDTLWLECTSGSASPGYMGSFTGGRQALLVTEDGSKLVTTPRYGKEVNLQIRRIAAVLSNDGFLEAQSTTRYTGLQSEELHQYLNYATGANLTAYLFERFSLPTYNVLRQQYTEERGAIPAVNESLTLEVPGFAIITGKRIFLTPHVLNESLSRSTGDTAARTQDLVLSYPFRDVDSVEITLPAGYKAETIPPTTELRSPFGYYRSACSVSGNKLLYVRVHEGGDGRFPASAYAAYQKFRADIAKADKQKLVLRKEE